jgi:phosphoglycerate kinase
MIRTIKDFDFSGKKVLVRTDFNVPLDDRGGITDDSRIKASLPTINEILKQNPKQVILMSHLDRPKGDVIENLRMDKVAQRLEELLEKKVSKLDDCVDIEIPDGQIILLENLRFHKEEKENNEEFAKKLASSAELYVNDAFGTCHRKHASVHAITKFLPSAAGLLVEKEVSIMGKVLEKPERPFIAIIGGVKLETKIPVIENFLKKVDKILIGGAMAFTFYKAMGLGIGKSVLDKEQVGTAKKLLEKAKEKIVLPVDIIAANELSEKASSSVVAHNKIPNDWMGVDIGPETLEKFSEILKKAKTIVWNGPMGAFEIKEFAHGTNKTAKLLSKLKATTIVGGGDSAAAVKQLGLIEKMTHVSTGGGASLEFLSGKKLPAIEVLEK